MCTCNNVDTQKNLVSGLGPSSIQENPIKDQYFDTIIIDHFQELENLKDSNVLDWYKEQGQFADSILTSLPERDMFIKLMNKYNNRKQYHIDNIKLTKNDQYFYLKRKADEEIFKLYYKSSLDAQEELILNPSNIDLAIDQTDVIFDYSPDWEGHKVAIALSAKGSDKMKIIIYDIQAKRLLPQVIENNFNASNQIANWLPNNEAFLYLAFNNDTAQGVNTMLNMKTLLYKIGDKSNESIDVFSKASCPEINIEEEDFPTVLFENEKNKYMIALVAGPTAFNDAYFIKVEDLQNGDYHWKPLYKKEDKVVKGSFINDDFIFISAKDASNHCIAKVNIHQLNFQSPQILIPDKSDEVIQDFKVTSSGIFYNTTKNGVEAKLYAYNHQEDKNMELPGKFGRIFLKNKSAQSPDLWITVAGWLSDQQRMKYDLASNSFQEEDLVPQAQYPEFKELMIEEITVRSHDGEMVPLSIISKKGIKRDGSHPTMLYGYGAYGISWRPYFLPEWLTWVESGGVLCFSHIRGGGEKGTSWHMMGKNNMKPNSWKDFIACAEYLIENKYTSNKKLAIYGGSAGGIVIGRSMTARPDLFAAIISEVGMLNALRIANMPSGLNHAKEFGYVSDSSNCKDLIEMDAYLHLNQDKKYPPFLAIIGMNDLRVSPWQSGKFIAKLQANNHKDQKAYMIVDFKEGHYFNSTQTKSMEKLASIFAFAREETKEKD